jgi:hypothetical protein
MSITFIGASAAILIGFGVAYHNALKTGRRRASRPKATVNTINHERAKQNATLVSKMTVID